MTSEQKSEAMELFDINLDGIPEEEREEYRNAFFALEEFMKKFERAADCILLISHHLEIEAESKGKSDSDVLFDAIIHYGQVMGNA